MHTTRTDILGSGVLLALSACNLAGTDRQIGVVGDRGTINGKIDVESDQKGSVVVRRIDADGNVFVVE